MTYRLPNGIASVYRNTDGPARFSGTFFRWIAEIEGRKIYCNTRQEARDCVAEYREERRQLIQEGERQQGRANLYEATPWLI